MTATDVDPASSAKGIEAQIAKLEAEVAEMAGKPEFTRSAASRRGRITRLRKQLPTSAPHSA